MKNGSGASDTSSSNVLLHAVGDPLDAKLDKVGLNTRPEPITYE